MVVSLVIIVAHCSSSSIEVKLVCLSPKLLACSSVDFCASKDMFSDLVKRCISTVWSCESVTGSSCGGPRPSSCTCSVSSTFLAPVLLVLVLVLSPCYHSIWRLSGFHIHSNPVVVPVLMLKVSLFIPKVRPSRGSYSTVPSFHELLVLGHFVPKLSFLFLEFYNRTNTAMCFVIYSVHTNLLCLRKCAEAIAWQNNVICEEVSSHQVAVLTCWAHGSDLFQ